MFILYVRSYYIDHFSDYKSITVTPQPAIYDKIIINTLGKDSLHNKIAHNISKIYPIDTIKNMYSEIECLKRNNSNINHISIVSNNAFEYFNEKNKDNNLRFISSIGTEKLTLITPYNSKILAWSNLNNKNIGVLKNRPSQKYNLDMLLKNLNIRANILDIDESKISEALQNGRVDAFFMIISHPSKLIKNVNKKIPIKFIDIENIDSDILKKVYPLNNMSSIDITEYNLISEKNIKTIDFKISIVAHKDLSNINTYNLVKTLFSNFIYLKTDGDTYYKKTMMYLSPSSLYPNNSMYILHSGVKKYFYEVGIISYSNDYSCRYSVGIKPCIDKNLNFFRLL
tara:strand:+ start:4926 stop:5948 length:1023 start_codon:yes stop_codon:yes gene_type:complete